MPIGGNPSIGPPAKWLGWMLRGGREGPKPPTIPGMLGGGTLVSRKEMADPIGGGGTPVTTQGDLWAGEGASLSISPSSSTLGSSRRGVPSRFSVFIFLFLLKCKSYRKIFHVRTKGKTIE